MLCPTPEHLLTDRSGRPYFLWDVDVTMAAFRVSLASSDDNERAYWVGKMMRQAKPDDALSFVSAAEMRRLWPLLERNLGRTRPFWEWLLAEWQKHGK